MSFKTTISGANEKAVITLTDVTNNTFAEIFVFGALLNKFCVANNNETVNVIDGFSDAENAINEMTRFFKSAKLSPYACRVKNVAYKFGENTYQLSRFFSGTNAIHGLLYDATFTIKEQNSNDDSASVVLEFGYDNNAEGFPFWYKCEVEYKLEAKNSLAVTTTVTNLSDKLMPVVDGWHPYFTLGGNINNYQVEFQSKEMLEFEDLIPTGKLVPYQEFGSLKQLGTTEFDNCFTLNFAECQPMCVIRNPPNKIQVEIIPSASYPYLQIYTPDHRKSIAVENLSAAPDAFNNGIGLKVLAANESADFTTNFTIRLL